MFEKFEGFEMLPLPERSRREVVMHLKVSKQVPVPERSRREAQMSINEFGQVQLSERSRRVWQMGVFLGLFILLIINCLSLSAQPGQLYLLAGQSNAVGPGDSLTSLKCLPNTAFEFDAAANDFIPLKDPVGKAWKLFQKAGTGSVSPAFAKRLNELTGQPVYMVTAARGGASCHQKAEMGSYNTWDRSGELFEQAVEKVKLAEAKSAISLSGIIWMQGERDANAILAGQITGVEYQAALEHLIKRFREKFGKKLPFYIVQTAYQQDKATEGCEAVRGAQLAVTQKMKSVCMAYGETGEFAQRKWFRDIVHYNQVALNDIGTKVAEYVVSSQKKR